MKTHARVVIVGGGYGGATAAKYIKLWGENIDVTLVEPNAEFVSCPISNLVLGGSRTIADVTVTYDNLARRHGVRMVKDTATAVEAIQKFDPDSSWTAIVPPEMGSDAPATAEAPPAT